jgi:magnesium chelatase family protein
MASKIFSAAIVGLDAQIIEVETDVSYGLRNFTIVGLPDKAVEESKERVGSAIKNSGFKSPHHQPQRVLVNLAPADLKKEGSLYDLPIALGYLLTSGQVKFNPQNTICVGELSLDGRLKPVKGVLSFSLTAKDKKWEQIILPKQNAVEAAFCLSQTNSEENKLKIIGVESLKEAVDYLENKKQIAPFKINLNDFFEKPRYSIDFGWIKGQESSKRALEIAAAGGHNLIFQGPPGAGKSLLARSLPSILPDLSFEESLEVTKIYSIAGLLPKDKPLINLRPFRSPHHTSSEVALIGGGNPPRPGEITLAHRGILFLDEFPEFHRDVLESLRQPLEEGKITISRAREHLTLPASFTLIAAANPCPCGYYKDPNHPCSCTTSQIAKYRRKLSGPLIDRIDLFIDVPNLKFEKLIAPDEENYSSKIKEKITKARQIQKQRFSSKGSKILVNAEMDISQVKKYCQLDSKSQEILRRFIDSGKLSARGYHRVLKTARTIADLEEAEKIGYNHITEALTYRIRED